MERLVDEPKVPGICMVFFHGMFFIQIEDHTAKHEENEKLSSCWFPSDLNLNVVQRGRNVHVLCYSYVCSTWRARNSTVVHLCLIFFMTKRTAISVLHHIAQHIIQYKDRLPGNNISPILQWFTPLINCLPSGGDRSLLALMSTELCSHKSEHLLSSPAYQWATSSQHDSLEKS